MQLQIQQTLQLNGSHLLATVGQVERTQEIVQVGQQPTTLQQVAIVMLLLQIVVQLGPQGILLPVIVL